MTAKGRPLSDLLLALLGPTVWAAHFFVLYTAESWICIKASDPALAMRWLAVAATAISIGILAIFLFRLFRSRPPRATDAALFLHRLSIALAFISIGAIAGVALPALGLSACLSPAG